MGDYANVKKLVRVALCIPPEELFAAMLARSVNQGGRLIHCHTFGQLTAILAHIWLTKYLEDPLDERSSFYGTLWNYPDARSYLISFWAVARISHKQGILDDAERVLHITYNTAR